MPSPFGNGPSSLVNPVPGAQDAGQTMAAIQAPKMPAQQAPAETPAPAAGNSPPPAQQPGGMTPEEAGLLQQAAKMSPEEEEALGRPMMDPVEAKIKALMAKGGEATDMLKKMSWDAMGQVGQKWLRFMSYQDDKFKQFVKDIPGTAASMAGGAAATGLAAAMAPEAAGLGVAAGMAGAGGGQYAYDKISEQIQGIKDPSTRDELTHVLGAMAGWGLPGMVKGFLGKEAAGNAALAAGAAGDAAGSLQTAQSTGAQPMSFQTAPDSPMGAQQLGVARKIMAGDRGPVPQNELNDKLADQWGALGTAWQKIKDALGPKMTAGVQQGIPVEQQMAPHQYLPDLISDMRTKLSYYKNEAFNVAGDAKYDSSQMMGAWRNQLEMDGIIRDGAVDEKAVQNLPEAKREFVRQYQHFEYLTDRDPGGFSTEGHGTARWAPMTAEQANEVPVSTRAGTPPSFEPAGGMLPQGLQGAQGQIPGPSQDIAMNQTSPGSPPQGLYPPSGPDRYMPPNPAGKAESGLSFRDIDRGLDRMQDYWRYLRDKGDPASGQFGKMANEMRGTYQDALTNLVEPKDPATANMLRRYNTQYSTQIDNLQELSKNLSSNPYMAVNQIIEKGNPDEVAQFFHAIPQSAGDQMRRLFADSLERNAMSNMPERMFDANKVANQVAKYPESTLKTIFGPNYDSFQDVLATAKRFQSLPIKPGEVPPAAINRKFSQAISGLPSDMWDWAAGLFRRNQPLSEYLSSPDFQDQLTRYKNLSEAVAPVTSIARPALMNELQRGLDAHSQGLQSTQQR